MYFKMCMENIFAEKVSKRLNSVFEICLIDHCNFLLYVMSNEAENTSGVLDLDSNARTTDFPVAETTRDASVNEEVAGDSTCSRKSSADGKKHLNKDANPFIKPVLLQKSNFTDGPKKNVAYNAGFVHNIPSFFDVQPSMKLSDNETPCVICDYTQRDVDIKSNFDEYLCHLLVQHSLLIADANLIVDLRNYSVYWKNRLRGKRLDEFCSKIRTNTGSKDIGKQEEYFLLCDALPEDHQLREELQLSKLKSLLLRQEFERKDEGFVGVCPFCSQTFQGNRVLLFDHMIKDHNFNVGHPDNIVNVHEFLETIRNKLESRQCLFCEQVFKSRLTLREHMRKKGHRCLNPKNKEFDRFYMINYLELGKNWQVILTEPESLDEDDDWSGWNGENPSCFCFFCPASFNEADKVYDHMKAEHKFDFKHIRDDKQLSFYQQVKMINYIRREVHTHACDGEVDPGAIAAGVLEQLTCNTRWKQPQYYFPACEDDSMLCHLEMNDGASDPEDTIVISEDDKELRDAARESVLADLVVSGFFKNQT